MRKFLSAVAVVALLAGCTQAQITGGVTKLNSVVGSPAQTVGALTTQDANTMQAMQAKSLDPSAAQRSQCVSAVRAPVDVLQGIGPQVLGVGTLAELAIEEDQALHTPGCQTFVGQAEAAKGDALGVIGGNLPVVIPAVPVP
jgi:predicted flap endonuclease-1-like 5' DNA nuclease